MCLILSCLREGLLTSLLVGEYSVSSSHLHAHPFYALFHGMLTAGDPRPALALPVTRPRACVLSHHVWHPHRVLTLLNMSTTYPSGATVALCTPWGSGKTQSAWIPEVPQESLLCGTLRPACLSPASSSHHMNPWCPVRMNTSHEHANLWSTRHETIHVRTLY